MFQQTFLVWLSRDSLHSAVTHSKWFPHLNTGWKTTATFVPCWPGYTFITVTETGGDVCSIGARVQSSCTVFQATSEHATSSVLTVCGCIRCEYLPRVEWFVLLSTKSIAWLNKEPIHTLVDLLCSLIHSLRWTLLFAGTTCVLVRQSGPASSLSILKWYGWKIASCRGEILCESTHTLSIPTHTGIHAH